MGAGLACKALLPQGRLALIWNYGKSNRVKGYKVYRADNSLAYVQDAGIDAKVWVVDPVPPGGYAGACYSVSAYGDSGESKSSHGVCLDPNNSIQTLALTPAVWRQASKVNNSDVPQPYDASSAAGVGQPVVGYYYSTSKAVGLPDIYMNQIYQVGLLFDLSALVNSGRQIDSAQLSMTVDSSWTGSGHSVPIINGPNEHQTSCLAKIGAGLDYWWKNSRSDWIDGTSEIKPGVTQGPDITLNVTRIVADWVHGSRPNFGLVLQGEEANLHAFTEKVCATSYLTASMVLTVQYH